MMKFLPLGGADEIGASCYYLNIDSTGILIDCGIHPQKTGIESLPKFELLKNEPLDFLFISHAHQDHIGAMPFLIKEYPHVKVYATKQTIDISRLTLHNSVNITIEQLKGISEDLLYNHEDIDMILRSVLEIEYEKTIEIRGLRHLSKENIKITFFDAGHILGSASILFEYLDKKIFYTGDIKTSPQRIMNGANLPEERIDILITESTYAATDTKKHANPSAESKRFVNEANKILHSGGSILIPVFSLGKMQEVLMFLYNQMKSGKLVETSIVTGGIGNKISHIYDLNRFLVNRKHEKIKLCEIDQLDYFEISSPDYYNRHASIVLAASGMMLENTMSNTLMKYWINKKYFSIFIVGYMDPATPGYKISSSNQGDEIDIGIDKRVKIKCSLNTFHFPSHSSREELVEIVKRSAPERVILVHGEPAAKEWFGHQILMFNSSIKVHSASTGNPIQFV